jgi:hypothetical protein
MKAIKVQLPNDRSPKLYKKRAKGKAASHLKRIDARRGGKVHSVIDDTFAALPIRKHARIELLIDQTTYGD